MDIVSVVEFTRTAGMYRAGDKAGFAPELAEEYEKRGFGTVVKRRVPRVEPEVIASDVRRRVEELRGKIAGAQRDAEAAKKAGDPGADQALAEAAAASAGLSALVRDLRASGHLDHTPARQPGARAQAS